MPWITPTEADILTRCSAPELDAFRSAALGEEQADPIAPLIAQTVKFMRTYIGQCPNVDMTTKAEGTIPEGGLFAFLDIIVPTIQGRPAGALIDGSTGIRIDARSTAMAWLKQAARCEVAVDEVPPPTAPGAPVPKPLYQPSRRRDPFA